MLLTALFLVLLSNCVLSQGIFDPYTYTQASCTGSYQWTMWFDTNDPNLSQGDLEITNHIQQLFGSFMCASPIAIEVNSIFFDDDDDEYLNVVFYRLKHRSIRVQH